MGLRDYASKRKFEKTPEPKPGVRPEEGRLRFVVHKHAARALHYDLRLELEGVLKSWAVPKGPSLDPSVKRLAVLVEDHPFEYKDFEGVIPEGNYGAGSVILWDRGFYHHPAAMDERGNEERLLEGFRKGDLKFVLEGEKLHGEFALVRTRKDGKSWLLMKKKDRNAAKKDILTKNRSVVSHKTLEEMLEEGTTESFKQKKSNQIRVRETEESVNLADAPEKPMPKGIRPMLAGSAKGPFDDADWIFEPKWDGYRAIAEIRDHRVSLYSRNNISFNKRFPAIADALRGFSFDAVMDGEIVIVDKEGRPDFQKLQHYWDSGGYLIYFVFDLLYFQGHDLTGLPLLRRKELLKKVLPSAPGIRLSDHVTKEGILFFRAAEEKGLEGIVAKHTQSVYETGKRSRQWLKVKTHRTQDAVIAGFTEAGGSRRYFGSLVLGVYSKGDEFTYIGHMGSGFSEQDLKEIHERLVPLIQNECPFPSVPETNSRVTWVRPELVCEAKYVEWTEDAVMRQPVFLRLREDKAAREVVREG